MAGFLDDDATLESEPLAKFMRMRKWMVLNAGCLFLLGSEFLKFDDLVGAFHLQNVSEDAVRLALTLVALYQLVMASAAALQIWHDYGRSLNKRTGRLTGESISTLSKKRAATQERLLSTDDVEESEKVPWRRTEHQNAEAQIGEYSLAIKRRRLAILRSRWPEIVIDFFRLAPASIFFLSAFAFHSSFSPFRDSPAATKSEPAAVSQPRSPPS